MGDLTDGNMSPMTAGMMQMMYGQAMQQQMRYQSQFSTFDAQGPMMSNPMMSAFSSMGPMGGMIGAMAMPMMMGIPGFGDIMSRLAMPAGTDLAAAARTRAWQLAVGTQGLGNMSAVWAKQFGLDPNSTMMRMLPMLDPLMGGALSKMTLAIDPNYTSMIGVAALAEASQWRDPMNLLDPGRMKRLQDTLLSGTRAEGGSTMRNIRFTAGFSNEELAQATLFAERAGISDTDTTASLRAAPGTRAAALKAGYTNVEDFIRDQGVKGAVGNVANVARRLQQGLMQSAQMPELLSFMENNGINPSNDNAVQRITAVIDKLEAMGRAAGMSGEAMMRHASAMQQQYGGSVMSHAGILAMGQGMDRMFRMESGGSSGFQVNTALTGVYSGEFVERAARIQNSQFANRVNLLAISGDPRFQEYLSLSRTNPAAAAAMMNNLGTAFNARARMMTPAMAHAARIQAEQMGLDPTSDLNVQLAGSEAELWRGIGRRSIAGRSGKAWHTGLDALLSGDTEGLLEDSLIGPISSDGRAKLASAVGANLGGMGLSEFQQIIATDPKLRAVVQGRMVMRHQRMTAAEQARFTQISTITKFLGQLSNRPEGVNALLMDLEDKDTDVIGKYSGAEGLGRFLVAAGLVTGKDQADATAKLQGLNADELHTRELALIRQQRALKKWQTMSMMSPADQEAAKNELLEANNDVQRLTGIKVDSSKVRTTKEALAALPTEKLTTAITELPKTLAGLFTGEGGILASIGKVIGDVLSPKDKDGKPVAAKPLDINIHVTTEDGVDADVTVPAGSGRDVNTTVDKSAKR